MCSHGCNCPTSWEQANAALSDLIDFVLKAIGVLILVGVVGAAIAGVTVVPLIYVFDEEGSSLTTEQAFGWAAGLAAVVWVASIVWGEVRHRRTQEHQLGTCICGTTNRRQHEDYWL